jgi:hypothetical protein
VICLEVVHVICISHSVECNPHIMLLALRVSVV